jgi:hypothetical protein
MGTKKPREERRTISLNARLRSDDGWRDVTIGNVSSRGLMLRGSTLPQRGTFIEVRHQDLCIVGRVVWSQGLRAGVRTQEFVDVPMLIGSPTARIRKAGLEKRRVNRTQTRAPPPQSADRAEASRRFARIFEWSAIAAGGVLLAIGAAGAAFSALEAPMGKAREALQQFSDGEGS